MRSDRRALFRQLATLIVVQLSLSHQASAADFRLGALAGNWAGSGSYTEGISTARLICRLAARGADERIRMTGRCGSSLGNEEIDMDLVLGADGTIAQA